MIEKPETKFSELRQDLVSGEWVVIATGRGRRPNDFAVKNGEKAKTTAPANCPFDFLEDDAKLVVTKKGEVMETGKINRESANDWFVSVIPNKYPALSLVNRCAEFYPAGPYRFTEGVGFHEVIVTRPHDRTMAEMSVTEVAHVVRSYRERYKKLSDEECIEYISILHNHGPLSGASVAHPHSQLIAIPVVPPDVLRSIAGSERYFVTKKQCVHCVIVDFEQKEGKRVIFENEHFIAFAPFASHAAFEIRIFPKRHEAEFQLIDETELLAFAEAFRVALAKLHYGLKNPSYNFFIHTAPTKPKGGYLHYHWHLEILPKTSVWGGFEFGTGIEISTIAPEDAAEFLRNVKVPLKI